MLIFSFRARAGRLSFVDFFFPYIDVASHVFVVSVMCIFKNSIPTRDLLGIYPAAGTLVNRLPGSFMQVCFCALQNSPLAHSP